MPFWVSPFEDRLGDLVNGSLDSSVRYLDRPWIRGILSLQRGEVPRNAPTTKEGLYNSSHFSNRPNSLLTS
jgi:hypothetical protein